MICVRNGQRLKRILVIIFVITCLQFLLNLPAHDRNKTFPYNTLIGIKANLTRNESAVAPTIDSGIKSVRVDSRNDISIPIPKWQQKLKKSSNHDRNIPRFLVSALQVRIYDYDKAKWTIRELKQWIHYVLWAGVEHIYVCDHYKWKNETLKPLLQRYIDANLLTYMEWDTIRKPITAQVRCYQHIIDKYKNVSKWQIAIDMDEYPYISTDTAEGFLTRFLQKVSSDISEVSMPNFLMLGQGNRSKDVMIERITRIKDKNKKSNALDKPIYRPEKVRAGIHHNGIIKGKVLEESGSKLKNLHYWGARLQDWKPDDDKTFSETVSFTEVRDTFGPIVRQSLISFGELDAFSSSTGP